jgi:heme-degrading monooxygenase HmoA
MRVVSRHWKGVARLEEAGNYIAHLQHETFPSLSEIDGFVSASILRRTTDIGAEFLIVTKWQSMEAIRQFAGNTAHIAVVPAVVQAMMIEYDKEVAHYEVVENYAG